MIGVNMISANFEDLLGKTIKTINRYDDGEYEATHGDDIAGDVLEFILDCGARYIMYHRFGCYYCEESYLEDICGSLDDIIGHKVLLAEKVSSLEKLSLGRQQWTFYKIVTNRGGVTIRWNSTARGAYSVDVDFDMILDDDEMEKLVAASKIEAEDKILELFTDEESLSVVLENIDLNKGFLRSMVLSYSKEEIMKLALYERQRPA